MYNYKNMSKEERLESLRAEFANLEDQMASNNRQYMVQADLRKAFGDDAPMHLAWVDPATIWHERIALSKRMHAIEAEIAELIEVT
jgi:hypothetical protein